MGVIELARVDSRQYVPIRDKKSKNTIYPINSLWLQLEDRSDIIMNLDDPVKPYCIFSDDVCCVKVSKILYYA